MLYKTMIRTVMTYGCEAWTLTVRDAETIDRFERRVLRRILGPVREGSIWRIRHNEEIYSLLDVPKLSTHIRLLRLQWAGHVQRMPDTRVPKRIFAGNPGGRRRVGRPRLRWMDGVSGDALELLGVRNWRSIAEDRVMWRQMIGEAKARYGL